MLLMYLTIFIKLKETSNGIMDNIVYNGMDITLSNYTHFIFFLNQPYKVNSIIFILETRGLRLTCK